MTPDPTSALIAACRELIQTMYPVIDVLQTELAGGTGHLALNTASELDALGLEAGTGGPDVPARSVPPAS
jgi:hypothetical protein